MPTRPKILLAEPLGFSSKAAALLGQWAEVDLVDVPAPRLRDAFQDYDILWIRLAHRITAELVINPIRCRILATPVTGLDHIDLDACIEAGIRVASLRGETEFLRTVRATAELTLALLLALIRRIPHASQSTLLGEWERDRFQGTELFGKTIGIIGMGRLGTIVAEYCRALGMKVIAYDPHQEIPAQLARTMHSLPEILGLADVISVHVNYHSGTRHLLNREAFAQMKKGAVLVNTARGGVVDDTALLEYLQNGHLAGAALDVLDGEPEIGEQHPLVAYARKQPNLLITPHIGGNTGESFEKTELFLAKKVESYWNGMETMA